MLSPPELAVRVEEERHSHVGDRGGHPDAGGEDPEAAAGDGEKGQRPSRLKLLIEKHLKERAEREKAKNDKSVDGADGGEKSERKR